MYMPRILTTTAVTAAATLLAVQTATAQTDEVASEALRKEALTKTSTTIPDGWRVTAKLGGSINITDARNVVGATEGTAIQVGLNIGAEAKYKQDQHTWDTILTIQEALQRTPNANDEVGSSFVKSLDNLDLLSTYIYRFSDPDWLGPFAQFKLNTQIFPTTTTPGEEFRIERQLEDGTIELDDANRAAGSDVDQNGAFEPLLLRETVGLFGQPYNEKVLSVDLKLGLGAQQTIVRDGFTLVGVESRDGVDPDGPISVYILKELESTFDVGIEATIQAKGFILEDVLTWYAGVVAYLPFASTSDLDFIDRLNLEITGGISLKVTKSLSFDWNLLVRRFPQVIEEFQVQNGFLLTLTMDLL